MGGTQTAQGATNSGMKQRAPIRRDVGAGHTTRGNCWNGPLVVQSWKRGSDGGNKQTSLSNRRTCQVDNSGKYQRSQLHKLGVGVGGGRAPSTKHGARHLRELREQSHTHHVVLGQTSSVRHASSLQRACNRSEGSVGTRCTRRRSTRQSKGLHAGRNTAVAGLPGKGRGGGKAAGSPCQESAEECTASSSCT